MPQDNWLKTVRKIVRYHKRELKLNPLHCQKDTANALGIDPKIITMCLAIYPFLADPEVKSKLGLKGAYKEVLERRKIRKEAIIERLFL